MNQKNILESSKGLNSTTIAAGFPEEFEKFGTRFSVMVGENRMLDFLRKQLGYFEPSLMRADLLVFQLRQGLALDTHPGEIQRVLDVLQWIKPWALGLRDHDAVADQVVIHWASRRHLRKKYSEWGRLRTEFYRLQIPSVLWPILELQVLGVSEARFSECLSKLLPVRQIHDDERSAIFAISVVLDWIEDPDFPDQCLGNDVHSAFSVDSAQLMTALYSMRCRKEGR